MLVTVENVLIVVRPDGILGNYTAQTAGRAAKCRQDPDRDLGLV
jgi:hypothetical protein